MCLLLVADVKQLFPVNPVCQDYLMHRIFNKVLIILMLVDFPSRPTDPLTLMFRLVLVEDLVLIMCQNAGKFKKGGH